MKYEITTLKTKRAFAEALKECMMTKKLSKISVTQIVNMCGVNRKTFYYHFTDIYDLLKWILEEEAINVVKQFDMMIDYKDAIYFVINYVQENKYILNCAYDSLGREEMRKFLYNDFYNITESYIKSTEEKLKVKLTSDFEKFLTKLYTETIGSMIVVEFQEKDEIDIDKTMEFMATYLENSIDAVVKNGIMK